MSGIGDRLLLLVSALAVAAALFGWMFVADRHLGLTRESLFFVGGILMYGVVTLYILRQQVFHRLHQPGKRALAVLVVECPVALAFLLLRSGMVPWPRSMAPYLLGSVLIGPLMIVVVDRLFRSQR